MDSDFYRKLIVRLLESKSCQFSGSVNIKFSNVMSAPSKQWLSHEEQKCTSSGEESHCLVAYMSRKEMTCKISIRRSAPPSRRCRHGRSNKAALLSTLHQHRILFHKGQARHEFNIQKFCSGRSFRSAFSVQDKFPSYTNLSRTNQLVN